MDINKAHEADQGFLVSDGPFYTGGTASPVGLDLPTGTFYLQDTASGVLIFRKVNGGANDWRQLSAEDVPFDVSNLILNSPDLTGLTETKQVVDALAQRNFGKLYSSGGTDPNTTSTGAVVEAASTVPMDAEDSGTITFKAQWSFRMNNSKNNTDGEVVISWRSDSNPGGSALDQQTSDGQSGNSFGGGTGEQTVGFGEFSFTGPQENVELYATIERVSGNGSARVNSVRLELWRI